MEICWGRLVGKVTKALSRHWPSEHRPALFLFPPCPHSPNHLFLFSFHTLVLTDNGKMSNTHQMFLTSLMGISKKDLFQNVTISVISSVDPCHVWESPATRNVAALDTQMFPAALSQKCPKLPPDNLPRTDISSTWGRWFYLSLNLIFQLLPQGCPLCGCSQWGCRRTAWPRRLGWRRTCRWWWRCSAAGKPSYQCGSGRHAGVPAAPWISPTSPGQTELLCPRWPFHRPFQGPLGLTGPTNSPPPSLFPGLLKRTW